MTRVNVQRLFSTFPNSWPGRGLLLQRVVTAVMLLGSGAEALRHTSHWAVVTAQCAGAGAGALLLVGLWTPVCGTLIALVEILIASASAGSGVHILLATLGATLAMI